MATKEERNMGIDMQQAFSVLPNQILLDKRLAIESKILWVYIQGKPKDWDFSEYRIASQLEISEKTVRKYLIELEQYGYLVRNRQCTGRVEYYLFCPPIEPSGNIYQEDIEPSGKIAKRKESPAEKFTAISNKEDIVIKNINNTTVSMETENKNYLLKLDNKEISEVIDAFKVVNPAYSKWFARKPMREACKRLLDNNGKEKLINIINMLPTSNTKEFFPVITTPIQLEDKIAQLATAWQKFKNNYSKPQGRGLAQ